MAANQWSENLKVVPVQWLVVVCGALLGAEVDVLSLRTGLHIARAVANRRSRASAAVGASPCLAFHAAAALPLIGRVQYDEQIKARNVLFCVQRNR